MTELRRWCLIAIRDIYPDEEILVLTRSETYTPTLDPFGMKYLTYQHKLMHQGGHHDYFRYDPIIMPLTGEHAGQKRNFRRIADMTVSTWKGLRHNYEV